MKLIPFDTSYYQTLIDWVKEPETLFKFSGVGFTYTLTEMQLNDYILKYPDRKLYIALNDLDIAMAYGEIIPQDHESARLGHLIVGESQQRGKGVGQEFICNLNELAKIYFNIKTMDLFVIEGNMPAINCYLKCGFNFIPNKYEITYQSKSYVILKMSKIL
jgi:predicted GNAT family N-acyltransferase